MHIRKSDDLMEIGQTLAVVHVNNIFLQLSNQNHQIKICEVSHFCIILELAAYKLICFLKQTGILVTKTARNVHFGNLKFTWK